MSQPPLLPRVPLRADSALKRGDYAGKSRHQESADGGEPLNKKPKPEPTRDYHSVTTETVKTTVVNKIMGSQDESDEESEDETEVRKQIWVADTRRSERYNRRSFISKDLPDRKYLLSVFQKVDKDDSGSIDADELQSALDNGTWMPFNPETVQLLIKKFDKDDTGEIEFKEFCALWKYVKDWQNKFNFYDKDNDGSINKRELKNALTDLGYSFIDLAYDELLKRFDRSDDGEIYFDDFIQCNIELSTKKINVVLKSSKGMRGQSSGIGFVMESQNQSETDYNPYSKCGKITKGEKMYTCAECAMHADVVLCMRCFKNSRHTKHRFTFVENKNGNKFCDCGDAEKSWKSHPTCDMHF